MNREIKFRYWDVKAKQMINRFSVIPLDAENLMEYSGFKDKDGTEIYEGDLIRHGLLGQVWEVVFKDGSFKGILNEGEDGEYEENLEFLGVGLEGNDTEVVGNVYEKAEESPKLILD